MRAVDYAGVALKDLRRQPLRSGLTVVALVISTVILVVMTAIGIGGQKAIADQFGSDDSLTTIAVTPNQGNSAISPFGDVQQVNANATKLDDNVVTRLKNVPHVQVVSPRVHVWECSDFVISGSEKQFVAQAEGVADDAWLSLKDGRRFASADEQGVVILGTAYAKELNIPSASLIGKTIHITTREGYRGVDAKIPSADATRQENDAFNQTKTILTARIIGITNDGPDQNKVLIPLGWARAIRTARYAEAGGVKAVDQVKNDGYTTIQMKTETQSDVKSVAAAVEQLGYGQVSTLSQVERIQQFSATMWVILGAVAIIAIIAAALGVVNTMMMVVSEQRYVIGVWRACGARKGLIVRLFLLESGILGLMGGSLGVGIGIFTNGFVNQYVNSLLAAQSLALTNIALTPPWLIAGAIAMTTLFGIAAGLYPAYRAASEDPSRTLGSGQ